MCSTGNFFVFGADGFPSAEIMEYKGGVSSAEKMKYLHDAIGEDYDVVENPDGLTFFGIPYTVVLMSKRNQKSDAFLEFLFRDTRDVPPILGHFVVCKEINRELFGFVEDEARLVVSIMRSPEPDIFRLDSRSSQRMESLSKGTPFPVTDMDLGMVIEKASSCENVFWHNSMSLRSSDGEKYTPSEDSFTMSECVADCFRHGGFIRLREEFSPYKEDEIDLIKPRLVRSIQEYLKDASHSDIESWSFAEADAVIQMAVYGQIVWKKGAISRSERFNYFLKTVLSTTPLPTNT